MTQEMINTLDKFFSGKTIGDIDRNTFLICNLFDRVNKITISLVFMRDWDSLETDSYNSVIIQNQGAVFTFPPYWIEVPKELTMSYFSYIIDDFYEKEVASWNKGSGQNPDGSAGGVIGPGCPCHTI